MQTSLYYAILSSSKKYLQVVTIYLEISSRKDIIPAMTVRTRIAHDGSQEQWCSRHSNKEGEWLPVDQFHKGDNQYCKACRSGYFKETYDPSKARARNFRYYYNHDETIYDRLLEIQNGVCAICGNPPDEQPMGCKRTIRAILAVDHNHQTGKVRGLLCRHCNQTLGWARENPKNIQRMIEYIQNDGLNLPLV